MKKAIVIALMVLAFIGPSIQPAMASGIPTVDILAVAQRLVVIMKQIQEYEEAVMQTGHAARTVRQLQERLNQVNRYRRRAENLKRRIDNGDWAYILRLLRERGFYGNSDVGEVVITDPNSADYEDRLEDALSQYGHIPRRPEEVQADAAALGVWNADLEKLATRDWYQYDAYRDQIRQASINEQRSYDYFGQKIQNHEAMARSLTFEDEQGTRLANVYQGVTRLEQNAEIMKGINQLILNAESERAKEAAERAYARDVELNELNNRQPSPLLGRNSLRPR